MSLGLFKKRRTEQPTEYVPIPADRAHEIIEDFCSDVVRRMDGFRPPEHIVSALTVGILLITQRKLSQEAILEGQVVARLGYCTRSVEFDRLYAAREMDIDLAEALQAYMELQDDDEPAMSGVTEFAVRMVLGEPLRPTVEQDGPLWTVPGLGAQVRLAMADRLINLEDLPADVGLYDMLATWKFGFYLRTLEEFYFDENLQH
jgi:hypothetical protein